MSFKSVTKQQIEQAVRKKHHLTEKDVRLVKFGGYWWWEGSAVTHAMQNNTCTPNLDDKTLERWISDFEFRIVPHLKAST